MHLLQVEGRMRSSTHPELTSERRQNFTGVLNDLASGKPLIANSEKYARQILEETKKFMGGLGISDQERLQIVQAMSSMGKGHWFKCPNGKSLYNFLNDTSLSKQNS